MAPQKVFCANVICKQSNFSTPETGDFDGSFARIAFKEGDLIERGIMRVLPEGFDGNKCEECFTWSTERPNKKWAMGSGCSPFYNTHKGENANTRMVRYFDENRFEVRHHTGGAHKYMPYLCSPACPADLRGARHPRGRGAAAHLHQLGVARVLLHPQQDLRRDEVGR